MVEKNSKWKPKLSREELERRRLTAGEDLLAGMKASDVARKYGVNPSVPVLLEFYKRIQERYFTSNLRRINRSHLELA